MTRNEKRDGEILTSRISPEKSRLGACYLFLFPFSSPGAATRITPCSSRYKL